MNGVINLSVLDGWWDEGYDGSNGWAIKPASDRLDDARRNQEEARTLYEILQDSVVPLYYNIGPAGYSPGWIWPKVPDKRGAVQISHEGSQAFARAYGWQARSSKRISL